jgi:hypothetical protein
LFKSSGVQNVGDPVSSKEIMRFRDLTMRLLGGYGLEVDNITETTANAGVTIEAVLLKDGQLNTGQGLTEVYPMNQDVLSTSNVTFNNIFSDNFIQTDQILENTLNNGVKVDSWQIKTQNITSDALSNVNDPLSINLKYFGDSNIPLSISAPAHDDLSINFDCHNVVGFPDSYISGSVLGNIILDKNDDMLRVLVTNGNAPSVGFSKSAMNSVLEVGKTFVNINEPLTIQEAVICEALTTDPETQSQTVLITQSTLTDELFRRPYFPVYGDAVNTATPIVGLPVIGSYVLIPALYAGTFLKNCSVPVGNAIIIDAGLDSFMCRVSYSVSFSSGTNTDTEYEFAVIANSFNITASQKSVILVDQDMRVNVSCTFLYFASALDDISLFVRNNTSTQSASIESMTLSISKIFE